MLCGLCAFAGAIPTSAVAEEPGGAAPGAQAASADIPPAAATATAPAARAASDAPVAAQAAPGGPQSIHGSAHFEPSANEATAPEHFRLPAHDFEFTQTRMKDPSTSIAVWEVTFPSPVVTPHPNNNTIHAEYYSPLAPAPDGKRPGVIMLHILGGDFDLSRLFCRSLAHAGVGALFVKMPYYGPRRQPDSPARMVSIDPVETRRGMTQAVLDVRQATAWLGSRPDVDPQRLGVMGISLGGITSALAATAEPRLKNVCLILAGGGVGEVAWSSPHLGKLRDRWLAQGGTQESFFEILRPVDPVTYADRARDRRILMLNADADEVIPKACTESLWRGLGEPPIVWWHAGHYTAVRYLLQGLGQATRFFADSPPGAAPEIASPPAGPSEAIR